jgi:hypothetical protein
MPNDKTTNDTLLCMVSPQYSMTFSANVRLQDVENNETGKLLLHVLDWYRRNYFRAGEWFVEGIRKPSNDEIIEGLGGRLKTRAEHLITFKDSDEGKQRLLASVGL